MAWNVGADLVKPRATRFCATRQIALCTLAGYAYNGSVRSRIHRFSFAFIQPFIFRSSQGIGLVLTARPKVAELVFHVYGRSLHPELFDVFATRTVERAEYQAKIDITSAGHVVTWRSGDLTLTEVAASAQHPLPERRRLLNCRLKGEQSERIECRCGAKYTVSFQLEPVEPELFWTFQQELIHDAERQGLLHRFDASGRMALGAISYINLSTRSRSLLIQAFHTFPDDCAIVKSQSLFQLPPA